MNEVFVPGMSVAAMPDIMGGVKIVTEREGGLVEAFVPISLIFRQDVPVDEIHVKELADSIETEAKRNSRLGQLSPILLGHIPEFPQFPIIDGFHRVPALELLGREEVFATIRPNSTWEDVLDLRILAATTHRSVKFARLIDWVEEAFTYSPWSERIRVTQAFSLKFNRGMTGAYMRLDSGEVEEIKNWIDEKCNQWHLSPQSIYSHLVTAQVADPELVKEVRERKSSRTLEALTPLHLSAIAKTLPHKYELQRIVTEAVIANGLTVPKSRLLATLVAKVESPDEAKTIIDSGTWKRLEPVFSGSRARELRRQQREQNIDVEPLFDTLYQSEIEIARLTIENAILTGRYYPKPTEEQVQKTIEEFQQDQDDSTMGRIDIQELDSDQDIQLAEELAEEIAQQIEDIRPQLSRFLLFKFGIRQQDAEDIIQDAALRTVIAIKKDRFNYEEEKFEGWMIRVCTRIAIDKWRERKVEVSVDGLKEDQGFELPANQEYRGNYEDEQYLGYLKRALPFILEKHRRVFILHELFELSYDDLEQILQETSGNLRIHFFRAKAQIGEVLGREMGKKGLI